MFRASGNVARVLTLVSLPSAELNIIDQILAMAFSRMPRLTTDSESGHLQVCGSHTLFSSSNGLSLFLAVPLSFLVSSRFAFLNLSPLP